MEFYLLLPEKSMLRRNKKIELVKLLQEQEVHIALLQETILPKKTQQKSPSQDTLNSHVPAKKKNLGTNCQCIMTLIRNDITGKTENLTNNDIDWQKTTIWTKSRTTFLTILSVWHQDKSWSPLRHGNFGEDFISLLQIAGCR